MAQKKTTGSLHRLLLRTLVPLVYLFVGFVVKLAELFLQKGRCTQQP